HVPAFQERWPFHHALLLEDRGRAIKKVTPQVGMAHLTSPELDGDLHAVALVQELPRSSQLGPQVMDVDLDPKPDLLERLRLLLPLRLAFALLQLVLVLAVIEDATHRRYRGGGDLHEVESLLLGQRQGLCGWQDAELLTLIVDDPHLSDADHVIDSEFLGYECC